MDTPDAGARGAVDAPPVLRPKAAGSKSVDPNGVVGLQTAAGSVPTEFHDSISAAAASAHAAVVASAVSSMTALLGAATISPARQCNARFSVGSTSLRLVVPSEARSTSTPSLASSVSAGDIALLFQGHAPWPKEGPRGGGKKGESGGGESTTVTPAPTPAGATDATAVSTSTSRRCNIFPPDKKIDSNQGASAEVLREVVEEGSAASKAVREAQMKKSSNGPGQRPGWKYICEANRCNKSASFGFFGGKGQFCVKHKMDGMTNLRRGRCRVQGCPKPPTRTIMSGQIFRYCKEHQPTGLSHKCGSPGGCDNVATHAPPRLLLRGPVAAPDIKVEPSTADSTGSSCPSSAVTPKANGKSDVVEGSSHRSDNDNGDAGTGGVTTEAGSGDSTNSSSSSIPAEATEAVRASDGVGSAAAVAVSGKSETAADPSGASSSGAGSSSVVKKDVSSGDGEAGVPSTDVDTSVGVRQPTRCLEHAGPGWVNVYGLDNGVVGLERSKRRRASTGGSVSSQNNDYFWGGDDKMEGCAAAGRSSSKLEDALDGSTSSPQAADTAAKGEGKAKGEMDLYGDGIDEEDVEDGESELSPTSPGGGMPKRLWFGKNKGINDNCPHPNSKHYCHGKCKLCYMKEYNRRTRALARQKPAADKDASSEGDVPASPEGGAAPFVGLREDRRPEEETETNGSSLKEIIVTDKGWRKTISSCEHTDAPHYGKGFCRPCYMKAYNKAKRSGGIVVRLPAPPRVEAGSKSPETKGASRSGSKDEEAEAATAGTKAGALAAGGKTGASAVGGKVGASTAGGKAGASAAGGKAGASASGGKAGASAAGVKAGASAAGVKAGAAAAGGKAGTAAAGGKAGASAAGGRTAAAVTGGVKGGSSTRGLNTAVPKTTALPPPLCGACGQTVKSWCLVLICDGCGASFHLGCQGRSDQPFGEWFCTSCTDILLDSDSDSDNDQEVKPELPETEQSSSNTPSSPSPRTNAVARSLTNPASTRAYTRSVAAATSSDGPNVGVGIPDGGVAIAATAAAVVAAAGKGDAVGNSAMGWQTLRPASAATVPESGAALSAKSNGHCGRGAAAAAAAAAVGSGKWTLKGDVRGCRCPTCVSILLQSGGTRPPEATKLIVSSKAGASASAVSATTVATAAAAKSQRQRSPRPSPRPEDVSSGSEKRSTAAVAPSADRAPVARGAPYSRVVVRAGSQPAPSTGSTTTNAPSASTSWPIKLSVNGSSASTSSVSSPVSALTVDAPSVDARVGPRPSRGKGRKRHRGDEQSESMSNSSDGEAEEGANGDGRKGSGSSMSSDGESSNGGDNGGGQRRPAKKRAAKSIRRASTGTSMATGDTCSGGQGAVASKMMSESRKGVSTCGHSNRPVYSKGFCKPCYMVVYSNRRQAALGIKPRAPRAVSSGRAPPSDSRASSSAHAHLVPAGGSSLNAHAGDGEGAESVEAEVAAPGAPVSAIKSLRVGVRNSPCSADAGDAKAAAKKRSRSSSGNLLVSSDNGEASTVPATSKKTKVNGVAPSKTPE